MTTRNKSGDYIRQHPKDERAYPPRNEDSYQSKGKYPEPSVCSGCGAIFHKGRWQWGAAQAGAHRHMCPACQRIHDRIPAGIITITGDFFGQHSVEIIGLIHNVEARQKSQHPLQRIMSIRGDEQGLEITLTDFHLTHAIADAITDAYQGEADRQYSEKDDVMRVSWVR